MGLPCKQLHNYDIGGPYAGFEGAGNFYREIDRLVNTRIWKLIPPPWHDIHETDGQKGHAVKGHEGHAANGAPKTAKA